MKPAKVATTNKPITSPGPVFGITSATVVVVGGVVGGVAGGTHWFEFAESLLLNLQTWQLGEPCGNVCPFGAVQVGLHSAA